MSIVNLNSAVAGPKMAHLAKITAAFEFSVLTLTVPGFKPPKSSKSLVLLTTCAIFVRLNYRILTTEFRVKHPSVLTLSQLVVVMCWRRL